MTAEVRLIVVLPFPALLNCAVSPLPGGTPLLQFVPVDQMLFVVPFQVMIKLTASGDGGSGDGDVVCVSDVTVRGAEMTPRLNGSSAQS